MGCTGRYAEAWQYASKFCSGTLLTGKDDSGGAPGHVTLSCTYVDFQAYGVEANKGMIAYNITQSTSGVITMVSGITLEASGVTWDNGDSFRVVTIDAVEIAEIEFYLDFAAANIHAALAANGQCDCSLASWAEGFLQKLNIIDAAAYFTCKCAAGSLSDETRRLYLENANQILENIRQGKLELCAGETGSEYPALGIAEHSTTEFEAAQIIYNDILRNW